jgi:hypothetical protein
MLHVLGYHPSSAEQGEAYFSVTAIGDDGYMGKLIVPKSNGMTYLISIDSL